MELTEEQYLILNVLETLNLLIDRRYYEETGVWYIYTPSPTLPFALLQPNGEVAPVEPMSEL
ncbi:MAG: hypothetical protein BRC36_11545 [Cyanobacteria bacterium QH_2_48_84]|nr:MAG: hypothetical protein BRC36_11545 [Cyanobacteria bacterium QH_2_48_84]